MIVVVALILAITASASEPSAEDLPIVRVTKGLGAHGYGALRVSVVDSNPSSSAPSVFTYSSPFLHRWTSLYLESYLITEVSPGQSTLLPTGRPDVGDNGDISFSLPPQGTGVKGIFFGDPCSEPDFVGCIHFDDGTSMQTRLPRLLNALAPSIDFRVMIGDNLYDRDGDITTRFFGQLTPEAQHSVVDIAVLGNHDLYWAGSDLLRTRLDPFGNGFLQFNAQDSILSKDDSVNFLDLSVDPDAGATADARWPNSLPAADNFLSYYSVGNVGFITYSGAHAWDDYRDGAFEEACAYFSGEVENDATSVIFLAGHWNQQELGATSCAPDMDTPSIFQRLSSLKGCDSGKLRYVTGHTHCNEIMDQDAQGSPIGYLLGGTGVYSGSSGCNSFGFAYTDTSDERELVVAFNLAYDNREEAPPSTDMYDEIVSCFEKSGVGQCLHYGDVWRNTSLVL